MLRVVRPRPLRLVLALVSLLLASCSDGGGPAAVPTAIESPNPSVATAEVGTVLSASPSFVVRDAGGAALSGIAVTVAVGEGGGTLRNAPTRTAGGPTSVGEWKLGTRTGRNTLIVTVAKLAPFTIEATAIPGPPAEVRVSTGNNQQALAGDEVVDALAALVVDRFGNPIPQQTVRFDALLGGGSVAPSTVTTGADGIAGGVRWRLGSRLVTQTVRAAILPLSVDFTARARTDFNIEVRFTGSPSVQAQEAFRNAAERIRTAVIGDLEDLPVQGLDASRCGAGPGVTLNETIDDIIIYASVAPIDGVGRVLGRAGPCFLRTSTLQALVGQMTFDDADAQALITSDRFESIVLHEMLHVVGIGALWRLKGMVDSAGTADPRFNGAIATDRCRLVGFASHCNGSVPLENTGGTGTADVHWRESVFDRELMTGFAEATNDMPFSVITLGALADYGYVVHEKAADPFQAAAARLAPRIAPTREGPWEEVLEPKFEVSPFGFVQPIRPRLRVTTPGK